MRIHENSRELVGTELAFMQAGLYFLKICCKKLEGSWFTNESRFDAEPESIRRTRAENAHWDSSGAMADDSRLPDRGPLFARHSQNASPGWHRNAIFHSLSDCGDASTRRPAQG